VELGRAAEVLLDLLPRGQHPGQLGASRRGPAVAGLLVEDGGAIGLLLRPHAGAGGGGEIEAGGGQVQFAALLQETGRLLGVGWHALPARVDAGQAQAVGGRSLVAGLLERGRFRGGTGGLGVRARRGRQGEEGQQGEDGHFASLRGLG
jgi:hypothetical protein